MKVPFVMCDVCGRYLVIHREDRSGFDREESYEVAMQGHYFDVCVPCSVKQPIAVLVNKRKLVAEQNAALEDPLRVRRET